jgi:hypothetical protein
LWLRGISLIGQAARSLFNFAKPVGQSIVNAATRAGSSAASSRVGQGIKGAIQSLPGGQTGLNVLGSVGRGAVNIAPKLPRLAGNLAGFGMSTGMFGPQIQRFGPMLMQRTGINPGAGYRMGALAAGTAMPVAAGVMGARRQLGQINNPVVEDNQGQQNYVGQ